jgi:SET domain-containing protein
MNQKARTTEMSFVLKPSLIHGVGVFAAHTIEKNTKLRLFIKGERIRHFKSSARLKETIIYCIPQADGSYLGPGDFGRMSIGWYLNHSETANAFHKNYTYYAKRRIRAGEEITIDYATLED